jgi:hypothetical protein
VVLSFLTAIECGLPSAGNTDQTIGFNLTGVGLLCRSEQQKTKAHHPTGTAGKS